MSDTITLTIDGTEVETSQGRSVLEAALAAGICIPNLCYLPETRPTGACRVCLVEVEQRGRRKMSASCTLEVRDGMVVYTQSEDLTRARRTIVELLLAEAPESPVLQALAERVGLEECRYTGYDKECILCGRCVAACADIAAEGCKGFIGRGSQRHVALPFYKEEYCSQCNECTDRCVMEVSPTARHGGVHGVCGSELSNNEEIPSACEQCPFA